MSFIKLVDETNGGLESRILVYLIDSSSPSTFISRGATSAKLLVVRETGEALIGDVKNENFAQGKNLRDLNCALLPTAVDNAVLNLNRISGIGLWGTTFVTAKGTRLTKEDNRVYLSPLESPTERNALGVQLWIAGNSLAKFDAGKTQSDGDYLLVKQRLGEVERELSQKDDKMRDREQQLLHAMLEVVNAKSKAVLLLQEDLANAKSALESKENELKDANARLSEAQGALARLNKFSKESATIPPFVETMGSTSSEALEPFGGEGGVAPRSAGDEGGDTTLLDEFSAFDDSGDGEKAMGIGGGVEDEEEIIGAASVLSKKEENDDDSEGGEEDDDQRASISGEDDDFTKNDATMTERKEEKHDSMEDASQAGLWG